jgi:hypothetical protein
MIIILTNTVPDMFQHDLSFFECAQYLATWRILQNIGAFRLNAALFCGIKDNLQTDASTTTRAMQ